MGKRSEGQISKRGPAQYRARIKIRGEEHSRTFESRSDAARWLEDIRARLSKRRFHGWKLAQQTTLAMALEKYQQRITPSKKDIVGEQRLIQRLLEEDRELCELPLAEIESSHIADFIERRQETGVCGGSINRYLAVISHLFNVARVKWGFDGLSNPVGKGMRLKENPARERILVGDEEAILMRAAAQHDQNQDIAVRMVPLIRFAIASCMRRGELGRLRWVDINLAERTARITQSKNGEQRTVPLSKSARLILANLPQRPDGLVFGPAAAIERSWKMVMAMAQLKDFRFHDLRHEGITRLFKYTSLSESKVMKITGHKTLSQLKRYTHLRVQDVIDELDEADERMGIALAYSSAA